MSIVSTLAVCQDLDSLIGLLSDRSAGLITIDGAPGAGKTHLARAIADELGWRVLELDGYLRQRLNNEPFPNLVNEAFYSDLKAAGRPLIVEGVMIGDFVTKAADAALLRVYVKRVSWSGLWHYGFDIQRGHVLDVPDCPASQFEREVLAYHLRRQPHIDADAIFERLEALD